MKNALKAWPLVLGLSLYVLVAYMFPVPTEDPNVHLKHEYNFVNLMIFDGNLPNNTIIEYIIPRPECKHWHCEWDFWIGQSAKIDDHFVIQINPLMNPTDQQEEVTIVHESCHVLTWGKEAGDHGQTWHDCMRNAAKQEEFIDLL